MHPNKIGQLQAAVLKLQQFQDRRTFLWDVIGTSFFLDLTAAWRVRQFPFPVGKVRINFYRCSPLVSFLLYTLNRLT